MPNIISSLLTAEELITIYNPPVLNDIERTEYFTFNDKELIILNRFQDIECSISFAICLVFFKIKQTFTFFNYQDITKERQHVMQRYFPNKSSPKALPKNRNAIARIENKVLSLCGYQRYTGSVKTNLLKKLQKQASLFPRQRKLCQEFLELLKKNHVAIPGYTSIQDAVSKAWNNENKRVINSYYRYTNSNQRNAVLSLLEKTDKSHRIVSIKQDMKSFKNMDLSAEIEKHDQLNPIFKIATTVIPKLRLPATTINYYASMINYYNGSRLKKLNQETIQLYLLCYSFTRYQILNDNLLETLKKRTNDYKAKAREVAKKQISKKVSEIESPRIQASNLLIAIHDYKKNLIPKDEIFKHVPESELLTIAQLLVDDNLDEEFLYWKYVDAIENHIKLNLRKIFLTIDFVVLNNEPLKNAITYMKTTLTHNKKLRDNPLSFHMKSWIHKRYLHYIIRDNKAIFNRLEFLLYQRLVHHITTNKLTLKYTIKHKSVEDDLYPKEIWKKKKSSILRSIDYPKLKMPIDVQLKKKGKEINELYKVVNDDIMSGKNQDIKIVTDKKGKQSWRLKPLDAAADPNESLFAEFPQCSIIDVIHFVERKTKFSKAFESILPKSKKGEQDFILIMAVILANAIRIGAGKMAEISDLKKSALITAELAYVRTETLKEVIDILNNAAAQLPIFKDWYINGISHGSLDGVKLEVSLQNIMARHSKKHLGSDACVSAYNSILNCFPIAGRLIGANEYEGHYTFEMVQHQNIPELSLENVSTDKHGTNSLNYGLFDLTHRLFAPRIPKPHRETLWGFGNLKDYENYIVKPSKIINENFVTKQWDEVQRLVSSIITGYASPNVIIEKLSSKNYTSKTKKAFVQYNHIVRSHFILMYIHDKEFRRAIMRALNRGEEYNNLYQAITILKKGEFRGKNEIEMEIWNQCTRLISAIILYYNTYILNSLYVNSTDEKVKKYLLELSPAAWVHINMLGYYQFFGDKQDEYIERWIKQWAWQKNVGFC